MRNDARGNSYGLCSSDDSVRWAGYPFDAFAVPYSGFPTDDAAPNWQQCDFIRRWNASGSHKVRLVSATKSTTA